MTVITIREQSPTDTGFNVTLDIAENNYPTTVKDPFAAHQEQELEWYFEEVNKMWVIVLFLAPWWKRFVMLSYG